MKELIAEEGYVYALKSDMTLFGKQISLGDNDSEDNWIKLIEPVDGVFSDVWHEPVLSIQIKLKHSENTRLLMEYPEFVNLPKMLTLPTYTDDDYVYIYANFLLPEHLAVLNNYAEIITKE